MIEIDRAWLAAHPLPQPEGDTDKNKRGRVLAVGGSLTVPGALRLTGEAAFRAGAGKVQLGGPEAHAAMLGMTMPEAAIFGMGVNGEGELGAAAGAAVAGLMARCDALVLGPGMGPDAAAGAILDAVLADAEEGVALLLDAAMIGAASDRKAALRTWQGRLVFTPHAGEMAALMDCDAEDASPEIAEAAAKRFDAVMVLKTAETWIAAPGEETLHYPGGGHGLATGGSGDVLAGVIGGLLSRGAEPRVAAAWGVWLHGEAGRRLADRVGPMGFLGREIPGEVPELMASIRA